MRIDQTIFTRTHTLCMGTLLLSSISLTGCPDPASKLEEFQTRVNDLPQPEDMGMEDPLECKPTSSGGQGIPQLTSGKYLFGLAPNLNLERPMTFVADVEVEIEADGSAGRIISMTLDPRKCEDRSVSAGDAVVLPMSEEVVINEECGFSANFGEQFVAGTANCISGSPITAEIVLDGIVTSADTMCGAMNGQLFLPYMAPLDGSTFAARKITGEGEVSIENLLKDCEDVREALNGDGPVTGGEMPAGEMPAGEMPAGEMPAGEMPAGEMPAGEMPAGEMPAGEMPAGEMPAGEMPAGNGG